MDQNSRAILGNLTYSRSIANLEVCVGAPSCMKSSDTSETFPLNISVHRSFVTVNGELVSGCSRQCRTITLVKDDPHKRMISAKCINTDVKFSGLDALQMRLFCLLCESFT